MGDLLPKDKQELIIRKLNPFHPELIYIFGSYSHGRVRGDSDLDIAFLSDAVSSPLMRFHVAQEIALLLTQDVDLVDLREASVVFAAQIVKSGYLIYVKDPNQKDVFEMYVMSDYVHLNESRAPILRRIQEEGTIYGRVSE